MDRMSSIVQPQREDMDSVVVRRRDYARRTLMAGTRPCGGREGGCRGCGSHARGTPHPGRRVRTSSRLAPGRCAGQTLEGARAYVAGAPGWAGPARAVWSTLTLAVFLTLLSANPALSLPAQSDNIHVKDDLTNDDDGMKTIGTRSQVTGTDFLMMFGYLPQSDIETGALRTEEEMKRAIRRFQSYAQLPASGKLDQATREQMMKPRCGLPDLLPQYNYRDASGRSRRTQSWNNGLGLAGRRRRHGHGRRDKRYALAGIQWEKKHLTFRILNYSPDLSRVAVKDAVYRAFRVWSEVTYLSFTESYGHADMMIRFARGYHDDGYPFDGRGLILAHAFFPGVDRGGDVHFDEDEDWTIGKHEGTNLFIVAAHEIGHALGLSHSSVPGSLMFPWYQGYSPNFVLHSDDIVGIQYMYGAKPFTPYDRRPSTEIPEGGGQQPSETPRVDIVPSTSRTEPTSTIHIPVVTKEIVTVTPAPTASDGDAPPETCTAVLDAISIIRGEIFAFSGKWFWRVDDNGVMEGYPVKINRFWYGFPSSIDRIDAVFERPGDGKIVFFRGARYWMFNGNHLIPGFSGEGEPLTNLGLPETVEYLDTAFQWGHNKRIYFIYKDRYWRFNEHDGEVDYDYPRPMEMWGGVPTPVAAAFQFWDGRTYFFQGTKTWAFNDARMHVRSQYPKHIGETFLGCRRQMKQGFEIDNPHVIGGGQGALGAHLLTTVVVVVLMLHLAS